LPHPAAPKGNFKTKKGTETDCILRYLSSVSISFRKSNSAPLNGTNNLPSGLFILDQIGKIVSTIEDSKAAKKGGAFIALPVSNQSSDTKSTGSGSSGVSSSSSDLPPKRTAKKSDSTTVSTQSELRMTRKLCRELKLLLDRGGNPRNMKSHITSLTHAARYTDAASFTIRKKPKYLCFVQMHSCNLRPFFIGYGHSTNALNGR
jgi:hypothetical protein